MTILNNAYFKTADPRIEAINGEPLHPSWWSRFYEYTFALRFTDIRHLWLTMVEDDVDFEHIRMITAVYSKRDGDGQISNRDYHRDYFDNVRKKHGVDDVLPWNKQKLLRKSKPKPNGKRKVLILKDFVASVNHESCQFHQNQTVEMDWSIAEDYIRSGYVRLAV
jgi:hypothetical protein